MALRPGGEAVMIELAGDAGDTHFRDKVRMLISNLVIRVEYKDIYGRSMPAKERDLQWFGRHYRDSIVGDICISLITVPNPTVPSRYRLISEAIAWASPSDCIDPHVSFSRPSSTIAVPVGRAVRPEMRGIYGIPMICMCPMRDSDHIRYAPVSL